MGADRNNPRAGWMFRKLPKRLFPKKFSSDSVRTSRIDANMAAAYNSQRSCATEGSRGDTSHKPDNSFTQEIPRTRSLSSLDFDKGKIIRSARGKVIDDIHDKIWKYEEKNIFQLYRIWQGDRYQGVRPFMQQILHIGSLKFITCFSGNEYLFIQEYNGKRSISRIYNGRNEAISAKNNNMISWIVTEPIE